MLSPRQKHRLVQLSVVLAIAIAGGLAVLLQLDDRLGEGGAVGHLLGSFFALLAIGGLALWAAPIRRALATRIVRLRGREVDVTALARRILPGVAILVVGGLLTHSFHDLALSHDHAPHCFNGYQFWTEMLGRGRLRGWSHFWSFGYPSGELYPFGADVWLALFHAATLGLLSWTASYALALAAMLIFATLAMFLFARRFFGVAAGVVAATIWVLDPGGWYQGGWFWHTWLGVWPVTLSMAFVLLAMVKLADVLSPERDARRRRDSLWAAFWITASLLTHLLPLIVYPIALPCLLAGEKLKRARLPQGALVRFCAAIGIGCGLAAFSLIPMLARSDLTIDLGVAGTPLDDLGRRLVELRVFENVWAPIMVLAIVGAVIVLRGRSPSGPFFVLCGATFVLLSSDVLISLFHFERLAKGFLKIECPRMLLVAKLFWFPLAGHAAATLFRQAAPLTPLPDLGSRAPIRTLAGLFLVAALGAPVLRPVALHIFATQVDKAIEHRDTSELWQDLQPFFAWSRAERQSTGDFYRIAYKTHPHDHIFTLAPIFNQTPLYKVGYTSTQIFRSFPMSEEPALFEALAVKYAVADSDLTDPSLILHRRFGHLRVYRFTRYRPQHPFTLMGGGQADLVRFDPELIQLRLQGTTPGARLKLHVAAYPPWEATLNGRRLEISPATVYGMEYPFLMEVPAGDGDLVFRYRRRALDWAALLVTLLALASLVAYGSGRAESLRRKRWYPSLLAVAQSGRAFAPPVAAGVAILLLALVGWKLAAPPRLASTSVFAIRAQASQLSLAGIRCEARGPAAWRCGPHEVTASIVKGGYGSHFCLTAPAVGPLVLTATTRLGKFIEGRYDGGAADGRIRVLADDQILGETATRKDGQLSPAGQSFLQIDTRPRAGQPTRLRIELTEAALRCFDFTIVR